MILYILKMTICASLLLGVYHLFLEKEKMHKFKRFYLLFSLVFSITVPFVSIDITEYLPLFSQVPFMVIPSATDSPLTIAEAHQKGINLGVYIPLIIYITIVLILSSRFIFNIISLLTDAKNNESLYINHIKIVLTEKNLAPHSFGFYIFLNKDEYNKGLIENEVLTHEMAHIRQYHTIDIVFIELLLILFWFNPLLYIYKNRIKLNHEFLADEVVICACNDIPQYQMILIDKISRQSSLSITSYFNYSLTKKRLTMMTKRTSTRIAVLKKITMLPLFLFFAFTFCSKKAGNESTNVTDSKKQEIKADANTDATSKTVKNGDEEFTMTNIKVEDYQGEIVPPPPATKEKGKIDLSSYNIGDKFIDNDGHEWEVVSIDPPQLKTSPHKKLK